ncbi:hypothetical protein MHU86_14998 [Fragilaria crotonensis]|nr:hypothetical protein MHU86_14998 [Fragilaria crotonensis]
MMRGPGPPPPLGLFPNGIDVDQPAYSFDTDEWKATPNLQNESFRNEKSVSDREENDSSYVLVGNKTTWHKYNALGYHCYDDCFQFEIQWDRMIQSESDTLTFIWAMYTYHCNKAIPNLGHSHELGNQHCKAIPRNKLSRSSPTGYN